jgi:hypothetical protein
VLLVTAHCTFPQYEIDPPLAGGGAGTGAAAAGAAGGPVGTVAGQGGSEASAGAPPAVTAGVGAAAGEGGAAPGCDGEQWPVERCDTGCLTRHPDHCYDEELSGDELAPDCGGSCQGCSLEQCVAPSDCLSGVCGAGPDGATTCESPLVLIHEAHEKSNSVGSTAWSLTLQNVAADGGRAFTLSDLKIRYYFDRNGVTEPILIRATQSNLHLASGESRELKGTSWSVVRTEDLDELAYNAYVEVTFGDSGKLFPGDEIALYQQMLTGEPGLSNFDQRANYSFSDQAAGPWQRVTVRYGEQLAWGLEPRPATPRACFARGVNLNGPAVNVDGNAWLASSQAGVTSDGTGISQGGSVFPAVSGDVAAMLSSAFRLQAGDSVSVTAVNGEYLLYLYAVSPTTAAAASQLTIDGASFANSGRFRSQTTGAGLAWARLGPYRIDVLTGKITLAVSSGSIDFAGFELWYPE